MLLRSPAPLPEHVRAHCLLQGWPGAPRQLPSASLASGSPPSAPSCEIPAHGPAPTALLTSALPPTLPCPASGHWLLGAPAWGQGTGQGCWADAALYSPPDGRSGNTGPPRTTPSLPALTFSFSLLCLQADWTRDQPLSPAQSPSSPCAPGTQTRAQHQPHAGLSQVLGWDWALPHHPTPTPSPGAPPAGRWARKRPRGFPGPALNARRLGRAASHSPRNSCFSLSVQRP